MKATASRLKTVTFGWILAIATATLAIPEPARATTLLSTGVVHGFTPICLAANVGATPVRLTSMRIIDTNGNEKVIVNGNCNFPGDILPGLTCFVVGDDTAIYQRCVIEVSGGASSAKNIRGSMEFSAGSQLFFIDAH